MKYPLIIETFEQIHKRNYYKISETSDDLIEITYDDYQELKKLWCHEVSEFFLEKISKINTKYKEYETTR